MKIALCFPLIVEVFYTHCEKMQKIQKYIKKKVKFLQTEPPTRTSSEMAVWGSTQFRDPRLLFRFKVYILVHILKH